MPRGQRGRPSIRFSPAELAACGAQIALLLSPAVYDRTRPAGQGAGAAALWRRPAPLAAVISDKVHGYDANTVRVLAGHPVRLTLSPGGYSAFGGCADHWGCAQLSARPVDQGHRKWEAGSARDDARAAPGTRGSSTTERRCGCVSYLTNWPGIDAEA